MRGESDVHLPVDFLVVVACAAYHRQHRAVRGPDGDHRRILGVHTARAKLGQIVGHGLLGGPLDRLVEGRIHAEPGGVDGLRPVFRLKLLPHVVDEVWVLGLKLRRAVGRDFHISDVEHHIDRFGHVGVL